MRYDVEFLMNGDFLIDEIECSSKDGFDSLYDKVYDILKETYQTDDIEILCIGEAI